MRIKEYFFINVILSILSNTKVCQKLILHHNYAILKIDKKNKAQNTALIFILSLKFNFSLIRQFVIIS
jgi:hypothetical protein